ncbi:MAG: hypothetical protein M8866_10915 [marine benthic group bacterium]|jgi:hypothetical protein|nr:hypothetical protein [Candidatus Benthicola marisminoris]
MGASRVVAIRYVALAGLVAAGFTGLDLGIRLASDAAGVWGVLAASVLFPATIAAAPLIGLALGEWIPAVVVYGGGFAAGVLFARGNGVAGSRATPTS